MVGVRPHSVAEEMLRNGAYSAQIPVFLMPATHCISFDRYRSIYTHMNSYIVVVRRDAEAPTGPYTHT